jgi:formate dehydrogenase iron-sulfur subunit
MKKHAEGRIKDLKARGYANAGLYDPPGVKGTHVMYVLHHADKPEIYAGLPKDPTISPIVELWKGMTKYAGFAAIGAIAAASVLHRLVAGRSVVSADDERNAKRLAEHKNVKEKTP